MRGKLPVAILWHMHQPSYQHPRTGKLELPWVRLHASKDYLRMAQLLQEFPTVKANLTMVPSLRDQLDAERDAMVESMYGDECAEGISAFQEKRAPRFTASD